MKILREIFKKRTRQRLKTVDPGLPDAAVEVGVYSYRSALTIFGKIAAYWWLASWVWLLLIVGWLIVVASIAFNFEPASSGAVLVALSVIAETILQTLQWQIYPTKISYNYLNVWKNADEEVVHYYFTTGGDKAEERTEQRIVFNSLHKRDAIRQILELSDVRHTRMYRIYITQTSAEKHHGHVGWAQVENGIFQK